MTRYEDNDDDDDDGEGEQAEEQLRNGHSHSDDDMQHGEETDDDDGDDDEDDDEDGELDDSLMPDEDEAAAPRRPGVVFEVRTSSCLWHEGVSQHPQRLFPACLPPHQVSSGVSVNAERAAELQRKASKFAARQAKR